MVNATMLLEKPIKHINLDFCFD